MSRYQGFVPLLLILLCLWINIWRYPSVWIMLNGQYITQLSDEPFNVVKTNKESLKKEHDPVEKSDIQYQEPQIASTPTTMVEPKTVSEINSEINSEIKSEVKDDKSVYNNSSQSIESSAKGLPASNINENIFQHPVMSRPAEKMEKKEPKDSESELDNSNRYVYMMPQNTYSKEQTISVSKPTMTPAAIYRAPGDPGTKPMNLENPSY